jgi:hypothetical protein
VVFATLCHLRRFRPIEYRIGHHDSQRKARGQRELSVYCVQTVFVFRPILWEANPLFSQLPYGSFLTRSMIDDR